MGFRDDVVLRVRATRDGARIDARSSSRYGSFDFAPRVAHPQPAGDIEDAIRAERRCAAGTTAGKKRDTRQEGSSKKSQQGCGHGSARTAC